MFIEPWTVLGVAVVAVWTYLLLGRGMFWRTAAITRSHSDPVDQVESGASGGIVAIIPARNEAAVIARSVTSLLNFGPSSRANLHPSEPKSDSHPNEPKSGSPGTPVHVIVVDDASSDGTASAARAAAERAGSGDAMQVIPGSELPPGWSGKLWALRQGVEAARVLAPRSHPSKPKNGLAGDSGWLLLTDADVAHAPRDLEALLRLAAGGSYDLASLMVRLRCQSPAERLLIPAFVFFFFKLYPPRWVADPRRTAAGAAGGCIVVRLEALARSGGMEAIRREVIDDCALARAVKRSGGRVWLGLAEESASFRAYSSFASIGRMISRTAFNQLRHSVVRLGAAVLGLAFAYLAPLALVCSRRPLPAVLGLLAWGLMTLAYWPMVRYYRLPGAWAATLPAAACFYAGATVHSAWQYWRGRGGQWKGRVQDPAR
jgi:hopene-associated glycosyltransferase HpnB